MKKPEVFAPGFDADPNWNGSEDHNERACIEPLPALMKSLYRYNGRLSTGLTGNKKPEGLRLSGSFCGHSHQRATNASAKCQPVSIGKIHASVIAPQTGRQRAPGIPRLAEKPV